MNQFSSTLFKGAKKEFQRSALNMTTEIKDNATNKLDVRSGHLRQSIGQEVTGNSLLNLSASVFSNSMAGGEPVVYAPVHEYGAEDDNAIKAKDKYLRVKGGPYLNIPTAANKTPAGVMRRSAREVFGMKGAHIRGRSVWVGETMMFYLVKKVEIKPRLGMRDAVDNEIPHLLSRLAALKDE